MEEIQKAALGKNCMGHDGSELVNIWEMATRDNGQESLKKLCDAVE